MRNIQGSHYKETAHLPFSGVVKCIRADIKQELPDIKVSIRTKQNRLTPIITLSVRDIPDKQPAKLCNQLFAIMERYNYDRSDVMTDYFDCRFYGHVTLEKG